MQVIEGIGSSGGSGSQVLDNQSITRSYVDAGFDLDLTKVVFDLKRRSPTQHREKPAVHHTMGGLKIDTSTYTF